MEWSQTVKDYYPVFPKPRWGHGRPVHPLISAALERGRSLYRATLDDFDRHRAVLHSIPFERDTENPETPFWNNIWFTALDAVALIGFLMSGSARRYVEIGSGHSTAFTRYAIRSSKISTTITSIDPRPRVSIEAICDRFVQKRLEDCDLDIFTSLESGDILFFDGSHRVFANSDVTVFFLEVLPRLAPGVLVHIHDVFLPADYTPKWNERLYSEQYLLASMLVCDRRPFRVLLPNYFVCTDPLLSIQVKDLLRGEAGNRDIPFTYPNGNLPGLSFWIEAGEVEPQEPRVRSQLGDVRIGGEKPGNELEAAVQSDDTTTEDGAGEPVPAPAAAPDLVARLEGEAKSAQERGDFVRSIALWKELASLRPDYWGYPLGIALDLWSAGRSAESEQVFRDTAALFPDAFWIDFNWALLALKDRRLDIAEQRARRLQDRFADRRETFELLGDIAVQQRDMRSALRHFEIALSREPDHENCKRKMFRAGLYRRISERFPNTPRPAELREKSDYCVLFLNLDDSFERRARLEADFAGSPVPIRRVPGVRGSQLPAAARERLGRSAHHAGTLGTHLAHVAAWEAMLDLGIRYCLIVEDDAFPVIDLPSQVAAFGLPSDFDLCFVNERMEHRSAPALTEPNLAAFQIHPPIEVVRSWPKDFRAPGADGYLLSENGARKLLEFVDRDGFGGAVDWSLLGYSIRSEEHSLLLPGSVADHIIQNTSRRGPGRLSAYSLFPCLIRTWGPSVRAPEDAATPRTDGP